MNTKIIGVVVAVVALFGVAGFVVINRMKTPVAVTTVPEIRSIGMFPDGKKPIVQINVTAKDFSFDPAEYHVKAGDVVRVIFTNEGQMQHDWTVEGQNIATRTMGSGESDVIQFVAPEAGTYETFCSVGTHRKMGMVGKLVVE